jgi:hypothetical protein
VSLLGHRPWTRVLGSCEACTQRCDHSRPAPRHPAQRASESTVGLLACGSPPVTAFPGCPSGIVARARRLQLRGQLRTWNPRVYAPKRSAPHSLFALLREAVDGRHLTLAVGSLSMLVDHMNKATCGLSAGSYSRHVVGSRSLAREDGRERPDGTGRRASTPRVGFERERGKGFARGRGCPRNCMRRAPLAQPLEPRLGSGKVEGTR